MRGSVLLYFGKADSFAGARHKGGETLMKKISTLALCLMLLLTLTACALRGSAAGITTELTLAAL